VLDLESVAVDSGLVELLDRKLDALLVLDPEIGPRARHREQAPDPDHLVFRVGGIRGSEQGNACSHTDIQNSGMFSHGPLPRLSFHLSPKPVRLPIFYHPRSKKPRDNFAAYRRRFIPHRRSAVRHASMASICRRPSPTMCTAQRSPG